MQVPIRKSEATRKYTDKGGPIPLTNAGILELKETLFDLEKKALPKAIADVQRTAEMGDFSENAAYQEAKGRLRGINSRILMLKDRLARAQPIGNKTKSPFVELGSTVVLKMSNAQKTYEIVGPTETDPGAGRISHVSPLGEQLIGHLSHDKLTLTLGGKKVACEILEVK